MKSIRLLNLFVITSIVGALPVAAFGQQIKSCAQVKSVDELMKNREKSLEGEMKYVEIAAATLDEVIRVSALEKAGKITHKEAQKRIDVFNQAGDELSKSLKTLCIYDEAEVQAKFKRMAPFYQDTLAKLDRASSLARQQSNKNLQDKSAAHQRRIQAAEEHIVEAMAKMKLVR